MKIIIVLGIILGSVIALALLIAAFSKKDYELERQISISKSKKEVFDYVKYVKNADNYSKWNMADPASKKTYQGTDGTVGFVYAWDSQNKNVGKGEQTITAITEGERVDYALHFIKPFEGQAASYIITEESVAGETTVRWGFKSKMPYPFNIMLLFINMEDMLGKDLQTSLDNLKELLEKQ